MRTCTRCDVPKPLDEFYLLNGKPRAHCKGCHNTRLSSEEIRNNNLKRKYGMTSEEYEAMSAEQGHVCAICGEPETLVRKGQAERLSVDHCHTTGEVRGLLCAHCNHGIGKFKDSPELLRAALAYLGETC